MSSLISKTDHLETSIQPFHMFYDGTSVPYGKLNEEGEFSINYHTTSRYGYSAFPIWAVLYKVDGAWHQYKFFIGEAPHKENNEWVTYNNVPNFVSGAFGGAHFIDQEPEIPHIIDIQTDEFRHDKEDRKDNRYADLFDDYMVLKYKLAHCTFKDYLNGLKNRLSIFFGRIYSHTGYRYKYTQYCNTFKHYWSVSLFRKLDKTENYFVVETDSLLYFLYLKKDNKWCFKYYKQINDHVNSAC